MLEISLDIILDKDLKRIVVIILVRGIEWLVVIDLVKKHR